MSTANTTVIEALTASLTPNKEANENSGEMRTPADRLFNIGSEIQKAKTQGLTGLVGSKNTRPQKNKTGAQPNGETGDATIAEGILSAEALLSCSSHAPTGTQAVEALEITDGVRQSFEELRNLRITELHSKLAYIVPEVQRVFGTTSRWAGALGCQGFYALVNPLRLIEFLPYVEELTDLTDDQALSSFCPFQEVDGYPTIGGVPVWERQEWERIDHYNAFKLYRDMRYAFYNEADQLVTNRSMNGLGTALRVPVRVLTYLAKVYAWNYRVDVYDSWMTSQQKKRDEIRTKLMLDRHAKISNALIQKAFNALNRQADKMSPKEALEMLKLGLTFERLSLGLPADKPEGPGGGGNGGGGTQVNIVNQTNSGNGAVAVSDGGITQQVQDNMKKPDTLLSVLAVLQCSNAFNTILAQAEQEKVIDLEPSDTSAEEGPVKESTEEGNVSAAKAPTGTPGFAFNEVPREPLSGRGPSE